jgi:predicted RNA-binding protein
LPFLQTCVSGSTGTKTKIMEYFLGEIKYSPNTGIWVEIPKLIKAENKMEAEKKLKLYAVANVAKEYHNYMFVNVFETL